MGSIAGASRAPRAARGALARGRDDGTRRGDDDAHGAARNGFTLVEVMVALLIFGMIAAAGVAILSFSIRAQSASAARLEDGTALARTMGALSADLAQATLRASRDEAGTLRPAFVGEGAGVVLVRGGWTNIDAAPRASEQKVAWRVENGDLVRVAWPRLDGAAPLSTAPMLPRVAEARWRFRFAGAWSDRWDGATGVPLPQAIELTLRRADGVIYRTSFLVGTGYVPLAGSPPSPTPGATDAPR